MHTYTSKPLGQRLLSAITLIAMVLGMASFASPQAAMAAPLAPDRAELLAPLAPEAVVFADRTVGGVNGLGNLKVTVYGYDDAASWAPGAIGVTRDAVGDGTWHTVVYDEDADYIRPNKGARVQYNDGAYQSYYMGYYDITTNNGSATMVANDLVGSDTIRTVWTSGSLRITQTLAHASGDNYIRYTWDIQNTSGATLNDLRFAHGQDTCLGGDDERSCGFIGDNGAGFWLSDLQAIGVRLTESGEEKRFTLQGITTPYAYESTDYGTILSDLMGLPPVFNGALTNEINPDENTDNGYALEWRQASLAAGAVWSIDAIENFLIQPFDAVLVNAPILTEIEQGGSANLDYIVTNDGSSGVSVALSVSTDQPTWTATLQGGTPRTVPGSGSITVTVQVDVPAGASVGDLGEITLTADSNGSPPNSSDTGTVLVTAGGGPVCSSTVTVQNTNDSGAGSLRQALVDVCDGGTVDFAAGLAGQTVILTSGELSLDKTVTIANPNAADLVVSGNNASRVFNIQSAGVVTLSQLSVISGTVTGGTDCPDGCGGGAYVHPGGALTLFNSVFTGNLARMGGGIYSLDGIVTVESSVIANNTATSEGGGINSNTDVANTSVLILRNSLVSGNQAQGSSGGGITSSGNLTITNSTISGNTAANFGGGAIRFFGSIGPLSIVNSTIVSNTANSTHPGGIRATGNTVNLSNVILANNITSYAYKDIYLSGATAGVDVNNLIESGNFGAPVSTADPLLAPLADNGGASDTHALLPGSPALDAGSNAACPSADQRGIARPVNGTCDIGAFESRGFNLTYGSGSPQSAATNTAFAAPLALTVASDYAEPVDGGQVVFTAPGSGASTAPAVNTATISGGAVSQAVTANGIDGTYTVSATARGNLGSAITYALTNTGITAPSVTNPVSGTAINDATPTFTGTADVGTTITVTTQPTGTVLCVTTADPSTGAWSCTSGVTLPDGDTTIAVVSGDGADNESDPTYVDVTIDTIAPTAPTVTAPISGTAVMTNTPTFEGTGEPGGEVTIYDDGGNVVCTATVDPSGNWTCTPSTPLDEGEQTYDVTVTDPAGNESGATPVTIDVDTTAPPAPTVTAPISGTAVMTNTPTFEGTGEPGGEVNVYDDGGNVVCTATVDPSGNWTCTPSTPLDEGEQTYDVTVTDPAGNESEPTPITLTVDTTAPPAPTVTAPISGTAVMTTTPTFAGTGEPGGEVTIYDDEGNVVCTTTVDPSGNWTCTLSTPLDEGEQTFDVTVTDPAGNESDPTPVTIDVDTTAPPAPTVTAPISGTVTGGTPTFEGTGEAGGEVTIYDDEGNVVCTTTVDPSGNWTCTPSTPLDEGEMTYDVTVTDPAGNESDPTPVTIDVDTTAPAAPTVTAPISGTAVMTNTPTFEGTGEAGGEVNVYDDEGNVVCTTTVAPDGSWSCTPSTPLDEGEQTYEVTVTDPVGNESIPTPVTITVDTVAPPAPTVTAPISGTAVMTTTPTFAGTGEPGGEVNVYDDEGNVVCTTTVDPSGNWTCTPSTPLDEGEQTFDVTVTDPAGNESIPTPVTITVDTVAPPAPTVTAPISGTAVMTNTPTFAGMGEPGGEVTVYDDEGTVVCTATVDPSGNWTCTPTTPLDEGEQTYEVTVTDEAGNESTPTPITITVDTVAPPAPTVTEPISDTTVTDPTPAFAGTAEPGTTVIVGEMQGTVWVVLCEAVADENGNWACTPTTPLDNGEHTVTVVAVDEAGNESDPTTLIFTVEAALQAEDDTYTVPEGIPSTLDVLANDSTSGGPLTITQVSAPQYGVAVTDGATIVYTPTLEYLGTDTFTYTITDGEVQDTAQVTVTVSPVADLEVSQQVKGTIGGLEITLVARNLGPRPAGGAVISDTFPTILSNVTWTCAASGGAVCPNTSGTGDLDETLTTFPANGVVTYTVSAKFVLLSIIENNTVTITPPAGMFDLVMSNNTATRPTLYRIILPLVVRNALP